MLEYRITINVIRNESAKAIENVCIEKKLYAVTKTASQLEFDLEQRSFQAVYLTRPVD